MKAIRLLAFLLAVLLSMLCGCYAAQPAETLPQAYTVTVVDTQGAPVAGVMVQLCLDACYPGVTGADGKVEFPLPEADYKVSLPVLPAGYAYSSEIQEFSFAQGSKTLTITLKAAE